MALDAKLDALFREFIDTLQYDRKIELSYYLLERKNIYTLLALWFFLSLMFELNIWLVVGAWAIYIAKRYYGDTGILKYYQRDRHWSFALIKRLYYLGKEKRNKWQL